MRTMVLTNAEVECLLTKEEFKYYDNWICDHFNEEAISYLSEKYEDYFEVVEIPDNATDVEIIDEDYSIEILAVVDGKIESLYYNNY